jgi:hypothetical protein
MLPKSPTEVTFDVLRLSCPFFTLGSRDENWRAERGYSSLHSYLHRYLKLRGHPQVPITSFLEKEPPVLRPLDREVVDARIGPKAVTK